MARKDDRNRTAAPQDSPGGPSDSAIAVDRLVTHALKALADYEALDQEQVDHIVKKASVTALDQLGATFHIAHGRTNAVLLPHVIRYNGTVPTKLTGWPTYESYRAPERFQDIARTLGLPAAHPQEGVESLAGAVERLRAAVRIEPTFQSLGVEERTFLAALPQQALNAYEDQCAPANPRMPMLDDMQDIMRAAYFGPAEATDE